MYASNISYIISVNYSIARSLTQMKSYYDDYNSGDNDGNPNSDYTDYRHSDNDCAKDTNVS